MAESNFVDYVKIYCRSGKGGRGSTHMRREKYIPNGGPDGGDGALAYFLTNHFEYPWFMLALSLITFISFIDDIRSTSQGLRLGTYRKV